MRQALRFILNKIDLLFQQRAFDAFTVEEIEIVAKKFQENCNQLLSLRFNEVITYKERLHSIKRDADKVEINIPNLSEKELMERVRKFNADKIKNSYHISVMHKLAVNYLRHCCTAYDGALMYNDHNHDDQRFFHAFLKNRILDSIILIYPFLKTACDLQKIKIESTPITKIL